jgi:hypothetical protein
VRSLGIFVTGELPEGINGVCGGERERSSYYRGKEKLHFVFDQIFSDFCQIGLVPSDVYDVRRILKPTISYR